MRFNLSKLPPEKPQVDRLYLFEIQFKSGLHAVKFGKSSGKDSVDRMLQIQRDYFMKYRWTFLCHIKRDRVVEEDVFKYESELHEFFKDYQFVPEKPFDGSTELFLIDYDAAVDVYEYLLENGLGSLAGMEYNPDAYKKEDFGEVLF